MPFLVSEATAEVAVSVEILTGTFPSRLMALCPQAVLNLQNNKSILLLRVRTQKAVVE